MICGIILLLENTDSRVCTLADDAKRQKSVYNFIEPVIGLWNIQSQFGKEKTMTRLHVSFDLAVEICDVGILALIGVCAKASGSTVTFLLNVTGWSGLAQYFYPQWSGGFREGTLLHAIFVGEGFNMLAPPASPYCPNDQQYLIFTREVPGVLRNPRNFLAATGYKIRNELLAIKGDEDFLQKMEDEMDLASHHR